MVSMSNNVKNQHTASHMVVPFFLPTSNISDSYLLHIFTNTEYCQYLFYSHSNRYVAIGALICIYSVVQYSCVVNPMMSMKRQKDRTLKDELPRSAGTQCATGEQRNNSKKNNNNKETKSKQKQHPVGDVTGDGSKDLCLKSDAIKNNIAQEPGMLGPSVQYISVAESCPTLCDPVNCSMPSLPIQNQLTESTQTVVH